MEKKCIVQHIGTIEMNTGAMAIDPCYSSIMDGIKLEDSEMEAGIYDCYIGWIESPEWGKVIAFMEVVLDGAQFKIPSDEFLGCINVDSGSILIGDWDVWDKTHKDSQSVNTWYDQNVIGQIDRADTTDEGFSFISGTDQGDGAFEVWADVSKADKVERIEAEFIPLEPGEEYDLEFIDSDEEPDFSIYK